MIEVYSPGDLKAIFKIMREEGVAELKLGEVFIRLGAPSAESPEDVKRVDNPKPPRKAGKDGLFAEEQEAIYGHVKDAEG